MHKAIFHPSIGLCMVERKQIVYLRLDPSDWAKTWTHSPQKASTLMDTDWCLQADNLQKVLYEMTRCQHRM